MRTGRHTMFEKNLQIGYLLDFYGDVLPERRRDIMDMYYNDDLSLAEIADSLGITRQAVREAVKKTEAELFFYEEKLHLLSRFQVAQAHAQSALSLCSSLGDTIPSALIDEIEALADVVATQTSI